jgi:hypothetical protein
MCGVFGLQLSPNIPPRLSFNDRQLAASTASLPFQVKSIDPDRQLLVYHELQQLFDGSSEGQEIQAVAAALASLTDSEALTTDPNVRFLVDIFAFSNFCFLEDLHTYNNL